MGKDKTEIARQLDAQTKRILWVRERGRCYICDKSAHDAAHLVGRRYTRLRWDVEPDGNVHLLCRQCHDLSHRDDVYRRAFIERCGEAAWTRLLERKRETGLIPHTELYGLLKRREK